MKTLLIEMRRAVLATLILALICGAVYPLLVYGLAQTCFPAAANGSLLHDASGAVCGSRLLGQSFSAEKYFQSRPSAAGNGYDAANSSGSNLGPTSQKLCDTLKQRLADYRTANHMTANSEVPADAVTASGSGLDPHISLRNAALQAPRVATARHLSLARVTALIQANTTGPDFKILGDPGVNVLTLNLALDRLAQP